MKKLIIILISLLYFGCAKDDTTTETINQEALVVFRSQVIIIDFNDVTLSENEYQATLGSQNIKLSKSDEHKLSFLVPSSAIIGLQNLVIPSLNNVTIFYDIQDTVLSESIELTMQSFFSKMDNFSQNLDGSPEGINAQNALNSFNDYYANASVEEKMEIGVLYKANNVMFDKVIENIDIFGRGEIDPNAVCLGTAVIGMGASIPLLLAPTGATQIAGVILFAVSAYHAKKCGKPLWNEYVLADFIDLNGIIGTNQKNGFIEFSSDVNSTLSLNTLNRKLIISDANKTEITWVYFFEYFNLLNINIAKANTVIQVVNELPFVNFSLIPDIQLPATSTEVNIPVNQTVFSNIQFSINHPNLQLISSNIQSDGLLNIKIKIIGTPTSLPVESFLYYSYSDNFNSFSGSFQIVVDSCSQMTAPVISNLQLLCNDSDQVSFRVDFVADGTGALIGDGSGYCEPEELCYPTRLYFKDSPTSDWSIAYNAYDVNLVSGNVNQGTVEISLTSNWARCDGGMTPEEILTQNYPNFEWKVEQMNQCNQRSNQIIL